MGEQPEEANDFEAFLAEISTRFTGLQGERVDAEIERALRDLAEFLGTDRATLLEFAVDGASFRPAHSWARPPVEPYSSTLLRADSPWYYEQLLRGETVRFERLPDELPEDAPRDRVQALKGGIKSILTIPIAVGGRYICALSTSAFQVYRTWPAATVARVRTVGQILASAIHRRRAEAELEAQLGEIRRLHTRLEAENLYLRAELGPASGFGDIVGRSAAIQKVLAQAAQVAPTSTAVLLLGETGTGKELLARAIHDRSPRRARALVKLNCAALPPTLVESELFGHEKGAFTGATATRPGRFELADGGTLFLDEIAELPLDLQAKLLRVLQDGEFERVGGTRTHKVDVRIVAATNRDLARAIGEGRFRDDLYYRLGVFPISRPAAPRAARGHPAPRLVHHRAPPGRPRPPHRADPKARDGCARELRLAGQRAGAGERDRARAHPVSGVHAADRGSAGHRDASQPRTGWMRSSVTTSCACSTAVAGESAVRGTPPRCSGSGRARSAPACRSSASGGRRTGHRHTAERNRFPFAARLRVEVTQHCPDFLGLPRDLGRDGRGRRRFRRRCRRDLRGAVAADGAFARAPTRPPAGSPA